MGTPPSPARLRILEVLADGAWHLVDDVLVKAAAAVPPGRAWRQGEKDRRRWNPGARVRGDDASAVAAGARTVARDTLLKMQAGGVVERDGDRVRLAP